MFYCLVESESLGPVLMLNSSTKIYGESNIGRYMNRLIESGLTNTIQTEEWIDKCRNDLGTNVNKHLTRLNERLSTVDFLSATERPNIADYYNWSMIKQSNVKFNAEWTALNQWLKRLEESDSFILLLTAC